MRYSSNFRRYSNYTKISTKKNSTFRQAELVKLELSTNLMNKINRWNKSLMIFCFVFVSLDEQSVKFLRTTVGNRRMSKNKTLSILLKNRVFFL